MIDDPDYLYQPGSGLEVPGIESVLEYGDGDSYIHGGIPGALRINDRSMPDQVHVSELTGLNDDPDVGDSRTERAGHWGERAGLLMPRGRTVGVTGHVRSGNVARMRDLWRRLRGQFGRDEQDLIVHPPGEAPFYVNEVWSEGAASWRGNLTAGGTAPTPTVFTDGTLVGVQFAPPSLSAIANQLSLRWSIDPIPWAGEDLWITAIVKNQAAAAAVASISLGAVFVKVSGLFTTTVGTFIATGAGSVTTPGTTNYYQLSVRIPASTIAFAGVTHVIPMVTMPTPATAGGYTLRIARVSTVLLNASDPTPTSYVGNLPGFEHESVSGQSRSYGPCYVVNQARDPDVASATSWGDDSTSGATVDVSGGIVRSWPGSGRTAASWTIHNPSTTSRTLAIRAPATLADPDLLVVSSGRQYRVHIRLRVDEAYAGGALQVVWLDNAGAAISTSTVEVFDAVPSGGTALDVSLDGIVAAPTLAQRAYLRVTASSASTVSGQRLAILLAEPRFIDVSEYDPGDVAIDATQPPETGVSLYSPSRVAGALVSLLLTPVGARRRIPRPFLLRGVRALWDGKAPESQRNLQYRRDFTFSMRASDPRIYVREERHASLRITGTPSLVSIQTNSTAFTGFTSEGSSIDANVTWKTGTLGRGYPLNGVTLGPSEVSPPASGYLAQASLSRMYYSAGAITYATPQVTVSGNCIGAVGSGYDLFADSLIGGVWQYNYIGALLKRVSSGTWIEARYNSANSTAMNAAHATPAAPFSLELWCSHNTAGVSATTRLGAWDVPTSVILDGTRKHLRAYMDSSSIVYVELWNKTPNLNGDGLVAAHSFNLSSSLITLLGQPVAGRAGIMADLGRWDDGTHTGISVSRMEANYESPYVSTFDAVDYNSTVFFINCPVIGDADDVPVRIQLRGGIDTPVMTLSSPDADKTAALNLSGTFLDSDPVTIDMDAGTIKSDSGADYFARRLRGSRFFSLSPGQNVIAVQAVGWDSAAAAHVVATWRDALR